MSDRNIPNDLVAKLEDLIKQATTERSHFYVATVAGEAVREIKGLRELLRKLMESPEFEDGVSVYTARIMDRINRHLPALERTP